MLQIAVLTRLDGPAHRTHHLLERLPHPCHGVPQPPHLISTQEVHLPAQVSSRNLLRQRHRPPQRTGDGPSDAHPQTDPEDEPQENEGHKEGACAPLIGGSCLVCLASQLLQGARYGIRRLSEGPDDGEKLVGDHQVEEGEVFRLHGRAKIFDEPLHLASPGEHLVEPLLHLGGDMEILDPGTLPPDGLLELRQPASTVTHPPRSQIHLEHRSEDIPFEMLAQGADLHGGQELLLVDGFQMGIDPGHPGETHHTHDEGEECHCQEAPLELEGNGEVLQSVHHDSFPFDSGVQGRSSAWRAGLVLPRYRPEPPGL